MLNMFICSDTSFVTGMKPISNNSNKCSSSIMAFLCHEFLNWLPKKMYHSEHILSICVIDNYCFT